MADLRQPVEGTEPTAAFLALGRSAASVVPPGAVVRLSDMRWTPPIVAFLELMVRVLTPIQAISDDSRPYSILGQRFITTFMPLASANAAASSLRMPELHPDHLRPWIERQRFLHDGQRVLRGAEDIDHVDGFGDVGEPRINALTEHLFPAWPGLTGIIL